MFRDRSDAARQLAEVIRHRYLKNPLVLGVPRGGAVTAAVLAEEIGAEMDVVLARKLRTRRPGVCNRRHLRNRRSVFQPCSSRNTRACGRVHSSGVPISTSGNRTPQEDVPGSPARCADHRPVGDRDR